MYNLTTTKMETKNKYQLQKLQELKHACINCHPSMKSYYQEQYYQWDLYIKNNSK